MLKKILFSTIFIFTFLAFAATTYALSIVVIYDTIYLKTSIRTELFSQPKTCIDTNCQFALANDHNPLLVTPSDKALFIKRQPSSSTTEHLPVWFQLKNNQLVIAKDIRKALPPEAKQIIMEAIDMLVIEDISSLKPEIEKIITGKVYDYVVISKYSQDEATKIQNTQNNLLECQYSEFKRVGDWMMVRNELREYCTYSSSIYEGGRLKISYPHFVWYLMKNPSMENVAYLVGIVGGVIVVLGGVGFVGYRKWRKKINNNL